MLPMVQPEPILFNCGGSSVETASAPSVGTSPPSLTPDSDANDLDIFFDIDVDIHTFQRIESCDLQPGDTWRGMQGKMSLAAPAKKIRTNKKSDNSKPQSQINKCTNEKRRRELENETINQLEELLGTCLAEVKQPDKNGIVREATRQIQEVLNHRRECPDECPVRVQCLSPVQGGEVSSTQPQPSNQLHYSEITTLIEALKHYTNSLGWILLELNPQGEVECVTENIKELINQDRTDLYKKSIFSLLHIEDHSKLRPLLRDTQVYGWGGAPEIDKFQAIKARLIDHSDGTDDSGVVECVIHCAPVGVGAGGGAGGAAEGRVMCVIRRCTDASPALLPGDAGALPQAQHALSDHIVFRLDSSFTILSCEVNSAENLINSPSSLVGGRYLELVESSARLVAATHLRSATGLPAPPSISEPFRLRLAADRPWLRVIARSRLFSKLATGEPDFIMSSHELLADDDDGERVPPSPAAAAPPAAEPYLDFDMEGWGAPYLPEHADHAGPAKERRDEPDPAPPPAPPPVSHPAQPPAPRSPPDDPPNRLRLLLSKKPESTNRILKDLLKQEEEEATTSSDVSAPHTPLTPGAALSPLQPRPHHAHAMHHQVHHHHQNNSDMIIKMLHNSDEDSEPSREGRSGGSQPSALLSQLLQTNGPSSNGRSSGDGDYFERMAGVKRKFEEAKGSSPATTTVKRATPDNQQVTSSASSGNSASVATTSSGGGMSPLCQKNQILVSLLAKQQSTPLPPPAAGLRTFGPRAARAPAPPPLAPPHHHQRQPSALGQILTQSQSNMNGGGSPGVVRDAPGSHLESMLQSTAYNNANLQYASPAPAHYSHHQPAGGNRPTAGESGDSEVPSDKYLSDILEFIANMPDDRAIPAVLDLDTNQQIRPDYGSVKNEKAMINAITQSLMQCETASKSRASSSPAPPSYPTHSQGNMSSMSNLGSPMGSSMGSNMGSMGVGAAGRYEAAAAAAAAAAECRARGLSADHQRARLLQQQRAQQMLVSPEAAEQPQSDLGSTISALVTATPPNVTLTRTDYHHHLYHSPSQMGQNYGSNKITSSQQNPMLSRQLSVGSSTSGYGQHPVAQHSPALHTPMTPQSPYQRPPRPQLVGAGGYYDESYGGDYRRGPHAPLPAPHEHLPCVGGAAGAAGAAGGGTSEYVRNELRAVVGARAARPDLHPPMQPPDIDPLISFDISHSGGGGAGAGEAGGRSWELSAASTTGAGSAAAEGGDAAAAASNPSLLQKLLSQ